MASTYQKDPAATLPYGWDWSAWLEAGDTITAAAVTVPAGLTEEAETHDDTTVTVWLSGGTVNENYTVTCQITTDGGMTDQRSIRIQVRDR